MSNRKTEALSASATLDGNSLNEAVASFTQALVNLENRGFQTNREVLYDTLEVSIERDFQETSSIVGPSTREPTFIQINVSAQAVRRGD